MIITYRGLTLMQITGGIWIVPSIHGRIFFTQAEAKKAIDGRK